MERGGGKHAQMFFVNKRPKGLSISTASRQAGPRCEKGRKTLIKHYIGHQRERKREMAERTNERTTPFRPPYSSIAVDDDNERGQKGGLLLLKKALLASISFLFLLLPLRSDPNPAMPSCRRVRTAPLLHSRQPFTLSRITRFFALSRRLLRSIHSSRHIVRTTVYRP